MKPFPEHMLRLASELAEYRRAGRRQLLLLNHEGLHVLERWRFLRPLLRREENEGFI